jgi:hypothetical protein
MFSLKKLGLVGIAGLAAFAISCSDDEGSPGGTITGLTLTAGTGNAYTFTGVVAGSDGANVVSVDLKATGANFAAGPAKTVNGGSPTLTLTEAVDATCSAAGSLTIKIEVTAKFDSGDNATESVSVTHQCAGTSDKTLEKKTATVGGTGAAGSFVDLDPATPGIFTQAQFAANVSKIDIVYGAGFGGGDKIYSTVGAWEAELVGSTVGDISGKLLEDGESSFLYVLSAAQQATVKSATKLSEVADIIDAAGDVTDDVVDATNGTAFMVFTTGSEYRFVIISSKDGTASIEITNISNTK